MLVVGDTRMKLLREISTAIRSNRWLFIGGLVWIGGMQLIASVDLMSLTESKLFVETYNKGFELVAPVYYEGDKYQCNLCGRKLNGFLDSKGPICPFCFSRDRHRTTWKYFNENTNLFDGKAKSMLHIAPERAIEHGIREAKYIDYLSGDLDPTIAMVEMDITDIQYPEASFDVVYCSHVLEHVPDDAKAMSELYRVLKPGGWAVLAVPIRGDTTVEDPTVTEPADRERVFGQVDHVRYYGRDFKDRLEAAGFKVTVDEFPSQLPDDVVAYNQLSRADIYFCEKE